MTGLDDKSRILKARALALAREPVVQKAEPSLDVVVFSLAAEHYGIEISSIREIVPFKELTPVPCTPVFIMGIANIRGKMLAIVDLKKIFPLAEDGIHDRHKILILHHRGLEMGILANEILGVRSIPLSRIQGALPTLTGIQERFFRGITTDQVIILDVAKLLSDEKIIVNDEVP